MPTGPMQITAETVKNSPFIKCDCGGVTFVEKMMLKKISKILSPTGKDEVYPLTVLICDKCGKVPSDPLFNPGGFIPDEYLAKKTIIK